MVCRRRARHGTASIVKEESAQPSGEKPLMDSPPPKHPGGSTKTDRGRMEILTYAPLHDVIAFALAGGLSSEPHRREKTELSNE